MEAMCSFYFTDDYQFDNAYNFSKAGWLPARITKPELCEDGWHIKNRDIQPGFINFEVNDFKTNSGGAWLNSDGTISLAIHSNLVYNLREVRNG